MECCCSSSSLDIPLLRTKGAVLPQITSLVGHSTSILEVGRGISLALSAKRPARPRTVCSAQGLTWHSCIYPSSIVSSEQKGLWTEHRSWAAFNSGISPQIWRLAQQSRFEWTLRAADDDFEIEEEIEFDDDNDKDEEEEEDIQDFETDYDVGKVGDHDRSLESDSFISTQGEAAESVVDYKIHEEEFHKLSLQHCDFFIRKVPDPDDDVYDFREMYVTAPDTDIYAIPRNDGKLPKKPVRLTKSNFEHICVTELPVETLRSQMVKDERQVMKVFLMKHYKNRRADAWNFVLDFEQIYVIDSKTKSISRAKVTLSVPGGANRDRHDEVLLVHDDGNTFSVVPQSKRKTPDELVHERYWNKTKKDMDNYLRSFRDYPVSNWF